MARFALCALFVAAVLVADASALLKGKKHKANSGGENTATAECPPFYNLVENSYGSLCYREHIGAIVDREGAVTACKLEGTTICSPTQFLEFNLPSRLSAGSTYFTNAGGWFNEDDSDWQKHYDGHIHKPLENNAALEWCDDDCQMYQEGSIMVFWTDGDDGDGILDVQYPEANQNRYACCKQLKSEDSAAANNGKCPSGFSKSSDGTCYFGTNGASMTLFEATAFCTSIGSKLCPVEKAADITAFDFDTQDAYYWARGTYDVGTLDFVSWGPLHNQEMYCVVNGYDVYCDSWSDWHWETLCCH